MQQYTARLAPLALTAMSSAQKPTTLVMELEQAGCLWPAANTSPLASFTSEVTNVSMEA